MSQDSNPSDTNRPRDPLFDAACDEFDRDLSEGEQLASMLFTDQYLFEEDPTNTLPALDAITQIAVYRWRQEQTGIEKMTPEHYVRVPWWVIQTVAVAFQQYARPERGEPRMTLGETFKIEGGGQGRWPKIKKWSQLKRDRRYAVSIALRYVKGSTIEIAIAELSEILDLSVDRLWEIWTEHRDPAMKVAERVNNLSKSPS